MSPAPGSITQIAIATIVVATFLLVQLQAKRDELSVATKARTADDFAKYGIELHDFIVSSISLPEEVKAAREFPTDIIRLSIGIECAADLIDSLQSALDGASYPAGAPSSRL